MESEIRLARPEDSEGIRDVALTAWLSAFDDIYGEEYIYAVIEEQYNDEQLEKDIIRSDASFIVATLDGQVAGFVQVVYYQTRTELTRLFVHPAIQGKQIGSSLLQAAEQIMKTKNIKWYRLYVHARLPQAINFYKKHGFLLDQGRRLGENYPMIKRF